MGVLRNTGFLLWRNYIKRKRSCCSFCVELLFPVVVVLLFVALFQAFSPQNYPDSMYFGNLVAVPNLAGEGFRAINSTSFIALGAWGLWRAGWRVRGGRAVPDPAAFTHTPLGCQCAQPLGCALFPWVRGWGAGA